MKKTTSFLCLIIIMVMLTACADNLTKREDVVKVFSRNEATIAEAIHSNNFEQAEKISGIQDVYVSDECIDFVCGGSGMGPSTHYYGFFYSPADNLTAWNGGVCPRNELVKSGNGYRWEEKDGDNIYYVEKIGKHFFYYEAHF